MDATAVDDADTAPPAAEDSNVDNKELPSLTTRKRAREETVERREDALKRAAGEVVFFENLVPIRIDLEADGRKIKDTITWNLDEKETTPETFASILCEDMGITSTSAQQLIATTIKRQIQALNQCYTRTVRGEELRLIELDLRLNDVCIKDQFEWDIVYPKNSPEDFAKALCIDLGLDGEFVAAIAYSIREQVHQHRQTLLNGDLLPEESLEPVQRAIRDIEEVSEWQPEVEILTEAQIKAWEKKEDREARHARRRR
eukprot:GILK01008414.1.p1 GENE.GILK01008414.1~~GILK01008414.1.p1  ORF type:complete len:276 (+),score=38.20 GILK01008414.1:55-828(+)